MAANTPPRSMSPTRIAGRCAALASPMFTKSPDRRLISAGLPAPSQTTTSNSVRNSARVSIAVCPSRCRRLAKLPAYTEPTDWPSTTTWLV
jgi:hypothetical protein